MCTGTHGCSRRRGGGQCTLLATPGADLGQRWVNDSRVVHSAAWCGVVVWCGVVWCGVVWCGVVWCGVVCHLCCVQRQPAHSTGCEVFQGGAACCTLGYHSRTS
jgi:hypothetical protein